MYEILNGNRRLTLTMIRKLLEGLKIPAAVLIGEAA
ncbi:HTH-type transcriptional regulator / antitoxin HigA (plasmid) [Pararobbsia alpina]